MPSFTGEHQQVVYDVPDDEASRREHRRNSQACARAESTGIIASAISFTVFMLVALICHLLLGSVRNDTIPVFVVVSAIAMYPLGVASGWMSHASFYRTTIPVFGMVIVFVVVGYLSLFGWMLVYFLRRYPEGIPY